MPTTINGVTYYSKAEVDTAIKNALSSTLTNVTALQNSVKALTANVSAIDTRVKTLEKPNIFDLSFATVTKGATANTITGNTSKVDDLTLKYADLLNKYNALTTPTSGTIPKIDARLTTAEAEVKKIPKTATSVSTSTTTTTTNTTLQ